jgi:hypothetical protein
MPPYDHALTVCFVGWQDHKPERVHLFSFYVPAWQALFFLFSSVTQEIAMTNTHANKSNRHDGIAFTVTVGPNNHKCLITSEALKALCPSDDDELQLKEIFWEYEDHIQWVARRLVSAGQEGNPLILEPRYFS